MIDTSSCIMSPYRVAQSRFRCANAWHVGVIVPARDEADLIAACLRSVLASIDECGQDECGQVASAQVVVVADSCVDATATIAEGVIGTRGDVVRCSLQSVGRARQIGTAHLLRRL